MCAAAKVRDWNSVPYTVFNKCAAIIPPGRRHLQDGPACTPQAGPFWFSLCGKSILGHDRLNGTGNMNKVEAGFIVTTLTSGIVLLAALVWWAVIL